MALSRAAFLRLHPAFWSHILPAGRRQDCKANADVVDQFRRLLFFWADRNCTSQNVSRNVMYIVITLAVGEWLGEKRVGVPYIISVHGLDMSAV